MCEKFRDNGPKTIQGGQSRLGEWLKNLSSVEYGINTK